MAGKENKFQADLVKEIKKRFPGAIVLKNDANYLQGIPDLTVLWNRWLGYARMARKVVLKYISLIKIFIFKWPTI